MLDGCNNRDLPTDLADMEITSANSCLTALGIVLLDYRWWLVKQAGGARRPIGSTFPRGPGLPLLINRSARCLTGAGTEILDIAARQEGKFRSVQ